MEKLFNLLPIKIHLGSEKQTLNTFLPPTSEAELHISFLTLSPFAFLRVMGEKRVYAQCTGIFSVPLLPSLTFPLLLCGLCRQVTVLLGLQLLWYGLSTGFWEVPFCHGDLFHSSCDLGVPSPISHSTLCSLLLLLPASFSLC